jgi:hypothetical protein
MRGKELTKVFALSLAVKQQDEDGMGVHGPLRRTPDSISA